MSAAASFLLAGASHAMAGYKITPNDKGVAIDAGVTGTFDLSYPAVFDKSQKPNHKITEQTHTDTTATIKYEGGGQADIEVKGDDIIVTFSQMPEDVTSVQTGTLIPFDYSDGGTLAIDSKEPRDFPKEKEDNPHLLQSNGSSLTIKHPQGGVVKFGVPEFSYFDVTDNRTWNWKTFAFKVFIPYNKDNPVMHFTVNDGADGKKPAAAAAPKTPTVDEFGQSVKMDYPDKVKSLDELKADVESEKAYYDGLTPPKFDTYGGLPDSGTKLGLEKTGFFHCQQIKDKWFMVDPDGNVFYALGVCGYMPGDDYTYTQGREGIYAWLPPKNGEFATAYKSDSPGVISYHIANQIRKYGEPYDPDVFAARMLTRFHKWGFNCVGPFCGILPAVKDQNFTYVTSLPFGAWPGMPIIPGVTGTWDPFDPKNVAKVETEFAKNLPKRGDDPNLIGYYLTNEPLYEDLPKVLPRLDGEKFVCKAKLVDSLKEKYGTIDAFNTAWGMKAGSFDELVKPGIPVSTAAAAEDIAAFTDLFFETYYKLVADTFHKTDTHHMLIGNRFQSGTINNEHLVRTCAKYMDIVSFNYYTYGVDTDFLKRIYKWAQKPMMMTEWYYDSPSDSGLSGGGKDVNNQDQRGLAYRNYVEQTASTGFIVGATWFSPVDQSITGRWFSKYNGENGNSGIVAVTDRPWKPLLAHAMETNYTIYDLILGNRPAFAWDDPRFVMSVAANKHLNIPRAAGPVKMDGTAAGFPGTPAETISSKRLVTGTDGTGFEASFKLCWDDTNLYILADITDPTPMMNTQTADKLWGADGLEMFVGPQNPDQDGQLMFQDRQILLGGGLVDGKPRWYFNHAASQPTECNMVVAPNVNAHGYTIEAAIPFAAMGFTPAKGQEIRFDLGVNDSANGSRRLRQLMWNGTERNSSDRTGWGHATLGEQ